MVEDRPNNLSAKRPWDAENSAGSNGSDSKIQVLGSPSPVKPAAANNGGQKRPTSRFSRLPSTQGAYKPPGALSGLKSPYFPSSAGSPPKPSSSSNRLASLNKPRPASNNISSGGMSILSRYSQMMDAKPVQRGPAMPGGTSSSSSPAPLTEMQKDNLHRLQNIFKSATPQDLRYAVRNHSSYHHASEWLAKRQSAKNENSSKHTAVVNKSSKVEVGKSSQTIAQRYGAAAAAKVKKPANVDEEEDDLNILVPRRRLIQRPFASPAASAPSTPRQGTPQVGTPDDESSDSEGRYESDVDEEFDSRLLAFVNEASLTDLADISSTTDEVAEKFTSHRPFKSIDSAEEVRLEPLKPGSRKRPEGEKIMREISNTLRGYEAVDSLIARCEEVGKVVKRGIQQWGVNTIDGTTELSLDELDDADSEKVESRRKTGYFTEKPKLMADDVELKSYQQVGINWLAYLYKKRLSCILADEMGLGKTCQVIAFLSHLKETGIEGPHLVVVPSSTLENWLREFKRFSPTLKIEPYYGSQNERAELRDALADATHYDVMITTYNLACGNKEDVGFLKTRGFNVCVYDEGHMLKNSDSERYAKLMKIRAKFRLLLTGTPLQNNLKELISLLSFILPDIFNSRKEDLSIIFRHRALVNAEKNGRNPLLSEQRITKAKAMMTPFVLRRKKDQVLKNLPEKTHVVEYCTMDDTQSQLYQEQLDEAKKRQAAREAGDTNVKQVNVLMDLRKAASHPLLFRRIYTDELLSQIAGEIMQEEIYREANRDYIYEDMTVMSDFELNALCEKFSNTIGHHRLEPDAWMKSAKVHQLSQMLPQMKAEGDRVLIFSQFTQVLDILEKALSNLDMKFLRLDGSTAVDVRQDMLDTFYADKEITVFLLSTRAGGFGINLACANRVIIHDLSFNPHDDKQAEDRAHRVGQTREVKVIRMVTKDSIDEAILELANTKLALDASLTESEAEHQKQEAKVAAALVDMVLHKK